MPRELLVHTQVAERAPLELLGVTHLLCHHDHRVDTKIAPHERRMLAIVMSALQAEPLDVPFRRYPSKFRSLRI